MEDPRNKHLEKLVALIEKHGNADNVLEFRLVDDCVYLQKQDADDIVFFYRFQIINDELFQEKRNSNIGLTIITSYNLKGESLEDILSGIIAG